MRKNWTPRSGGGAVLEESVRWEALVQLGATLPRQARAAAPEEPAERGASVGGSTERRPVALAQTAYRPAGVVVDFEIVPNSASGFTFAMGQTYYIRNYFYVGPGTITFQPGCTIKFKHNAWLLVYGPVSFPDTLQTPVFTSKDDNSFGEVIDFNPDNPNDPDSDGNPSDQKAAQALWIYYVDFDTTVQNARFRWAQRALQYDVNPGVYISHTLRRTLLERCDIGVYANLQEATLVLDNVQTNQVRTPLTCPGYPYCGTIYGAMTAPLFYLTNSFRGIDKSEDLNWETNPYTNPDIGVPDTMGAVGTTQFIEVLNGKITVFTKTNGAPQSTATLPSFLDATRPADPRVWYDHESQRWVVSAMDRATNTVFLKVSLSSSASLASTNWRRYAVTFSLGENESPDFPTLGVDVNGIYLSTQIVASGSSQAGYRIVAFKKPDVYTNPNYQPPDPLTVSAQELDTWCIQPAYNFDASPVGGYAWLVAKGPPSGNLGGQIYYRRLQWNGPNPEWVENWQPMAGPYRDYYDIPQSSPALYAPYSGATGGGLNLAHVGSRLMMAVIRGTNLWTCHHVGLDGSDGDYDGPTADRSAVQWFKFQVGADGLTYSTHGRIYDTAARNPYWYHYPSLNVNAAGDLVVGFSGSRATEYIGAFFHGRKANGTWMSRPGLVQAGRGPFNSDRWGDYSATSIDPADGSFWTIQEYADPAPDNWKWGTWIMQVRVTP